MTLEQLKDKWRFENPIQGKEVLIFEMPISKDIKKLDDFEQNRPIDRDFFEPPALFNARIKGIKSCVATTNSIIYESAVKDDRVVDYK